ncbi:MAG: hypothetical protein ABI360_07900 [Allobranchiibius sp.]
MEPTGHATTVINGETYTVDGETRIVPLAPDHVERRIDLAVRLVGDKIPRNEPFVMVVGSMDDATRSLHVHLWGELRPEDFAWGRIPQVIGVSEAVADAVGANVPDDWDLMSVGQSKTCTGNSVVTVEVVEETTAVRQWRANQPRNSVLVYSFMRRTKDIPLLID